MTSKVNSYFCVDAFCPTFGHVGILLSNQIISTIQTGWFYWNLQTLMIKILPSEAIKSSKKVASKTRNFHKTVYMAIVKVFVLIATNTTANASLSVFYT